VKKIVSIIVLTALLTHLIGFCIYFVVRQGQIRQEMRESIGTLPDEEFETFVFTSEEYEKVRVNDFEVRVDGKMYDHSRPKFENGKITLFARHDAEEDNLISFLAEIINSSTNDTNPIPPQLLSFFNLIYLSPHPLTLTVSTEKENPFDCSNSNLLTQYFPIEYQPPRF